MPDEKPSLAMDALKNAALRLFAAHGIDGVTVRQIAEAAGQRNHGSVLYHFGSKEDLVRAVIVDGARLIEVHRNHLLDEAERRGGPSTVGEVTELLVRSSLPDEAPPWRECYARFVVALQLSHRALFMDALAGRWNFGYQRALGHIRRLRPDIARPLMDQRLLFMGAALGSILAAREGELADRSRPHPTWSADATLAHIARALAAMIESVAPA